MGFDIINLLTYATKYNKGQQALSSLEIICHT